MKNLRFTTLLLVFASIVFTSGTFNRVNAQNCTHYIQLRDTYGDGWNGNYVSVSVNGATVLSNITLSSGYGPVTYSFQASNGSTIRIWRSITGSWTSECRTQVFNSTMTALTGQLATQTGSATSGGTTNAGQCASSVPANPSAITASASTLCGSGQTSQLTAQGAVGTVYWYTGSCGGSFIGTGNPITVSPGSSTTYFARNYNNSLFSSGCASFTVGVSSAPANPTASGTSICGGNTTTLNASNSQNYAWYTNSNGTGQVGSGSSFTTPTLTSSTTYYVQAFGASSGSQSLAFNYTGGMQTWTVPTGVTQITFNAEGAQGGTTSYGTGGLGGRIQGNLTVTPGQVLNIFVGGQATSSTGGYNGGGNGGNGSYGRGGGGATDVRIGGTATSNRVLVAGAGGGGGINCGPPNPGGMGGGTTGQTGWQCNSQANYTGIGGSQSAGGANQGGLGSAGSLGLGGNGYNPYGGGGGSGYYGGGGGSYGGGGGGSSWGNGSTSSVSHTQGTRTGNGTITLTWTPVGCASSVVPVVVNVTATPVVSAGNPANYCLGQSATQLSGTATVSSGSMTYSWSPSTGLSSTSILNPMASPGSTQTYTLSASANGCTATSSMTLTVAATPSAPSASGVSICTGQTAGLSASGATYYNWYTNSNGTNNVSTNSSFTTPTLSSSTTYYVGATTAPSVGTQTFSYTGAVQTFTAPITATYTLDLYGAQGGTTSQFAGGLGARTQGTVALTAGQTINVYVGNQPTVATGGWNGGGNSNGNGRGGGGASDIRIGGTALSNRIAIASGGGGGGLGSSGYSGSAGAAGGGTTGSSSTSSSGGTSYGNGGTASSGGASYGCCGTGTAGVLGIGGNGANGSGCGGYTDGWGGGGGGGYYGGGGGGNCGGGVGGGGGSSFTGGISSGVMTAGVRTGNGQVTITWTGTGSGCVSVLTPVVVSITQPAPPTVTNPTICAGQTAAITPSGGSTYVWYTNSNNTGFITTGSTYTTPALTANTTYYVTNAFGSGGFPTGAGGTFTYGSGASNSQIAQAACEAVYGVGQCNTGSCGSFTYWKASSHVSCNCNKAVGEYEFIYSNTGYTQVGQDYGGAATSVAGQQLFTRVKASTGCNSNSWNLAQANLGTGFSGCQSSPVAVSVTVNPALTVSAGTNTAICSGASTTLAGTASGSGNITYAWSPSTGLSATNIANPVASPNSNQTYTLTATANGCSATSTTTLTVNQSPATPTAASASICSGQTASLTASGSSSYVWYTNSNGTGQLGTTASYTTPTLNANTTYYVSAPGTGGSAVQSVGYNACYATNNWAVSHLNGGNGSVNAAGAPNTITLTGPNNTGGNSYTIYQITVPVNGTISFNWSVAHNDGGYDTFGYRINGSDVPITAYSGSGATSVNVTAGQTFAFYGRSHDGCCGTFTATVTNFNKPCAGTNCSSPLVPVLVTVNQTPAAPTASNPSICSGQPATITASSAANWYTVPSGGTSIGTATAYTTGALTSNVTYYMEGVNGPCISPSRTAVTITVNAIPASNAGPDITGTVTCGKNTVTMAASTLASGQNGLWTLVSGTNTNILFTFPSVTNSDLTGSYGGTYTLNWAVTNPSTGCTGNDQMLVTFNQPNAAVLGSSIANGDLLWCGLSGTDWSTSPNWYMHMGSHYQRMTTGLPTTSHEVFTVNQTNGGMCIGNNTPTLSISSNAEDVYVGPGITLNLTNDSLNIAANLINDGTIVGAIGCVNFTGPSNGIISGSGNTQLFDMRVNKSGGATLSLQQPVVVTNLLTMIQGNVNTTTTNLLTLGQNSGTTGTLVYNNGSIVGPFRRFYASTSTTGDAGLFPVGTSAYNRYARVNFASSPGTNQYLTVRYVPGAPMVGGIPLYNGLPLMIAGAMVQNYSADGYWQVDPTGGSYTSSIATTNYDVTLYANNLTGMTTPQICRIIKSPGSNTSGSNHVVWQACGTPVAVAGGAAPLSFAITSTNVTGFSWFNIGTPNGQALPVELLSFSGNCVDGEVSLEWQTASEHNSLYFEVEKSRDGENWQVLTTVPSAGNSNQLLTYQALDVHAAEGNNYYRLNQVDVDGVSKQYDIINASCTGGSKSYFSSYPNPSAGSFQVVLNDKNMLGNATLTLRDTKGALLLDREIEVKPGINLFSVNDLHLAPGVYYIQVLNGDQTTEVLKEVIR